MTDILVFLLFFGLVYRLFFLDTDKRFFALLLGTVFFPSCVSLIDSPKLSVQHVFLYGFFAAEIFKNFKRFKEDFIKFPFNIPLLLIFFSYCISIFVNDGLSVKNYYAATRGFIEMYGFLLAAYVAGCHIDVNKVREKFFWPIIIITVMCILEVAFNDNYPLKFIGNAFPYYEGYLPLDHSLSMNRDWRFRSYATTSYPTAFGTLLCCVTIFYLNVLKDEKWKGPKLVLLFGMLGLNLFLCGSRTALLCTGLAVIFYLIRKTSPLFKIFAVICCIFGSLLLAKVAVDNFSQENRGSSIQMRQYQLLYSFALIKGSPIFGNGYQYMSKYVFEKDADGSRIIDKSIGGLESAVFGNLIDFGLLGLFMYYLFFAWIFFYFFNRRNKSFNATFGYLMAVASAIYFTLSGHIGNNTGFAFIFLGLLAGNESKQIENQNDEFNENSSVQESQDEIDEA